MFDRQSTHVALLLWGCIFCLIAALCMFMNKNFEKEKRRWMISMQTSTALLLGSDALAWAFRGYPGTVGYVMVRISNFVVFAATAIVLFFFHAYVCSYLFRKDEIKKICRTKLVWLICTIALVLVIVSQFTHLYYYFDADNFYHRNTMYLISMLLPLSGMLLDFSLLLQYRKRLSRDSFVAMVSYIVLPLVAAVIQTFYYGISLINIAICISMILIFVAAVSEQSRLMKRLSESKDEAIEQLEVSTTINRCVTELSSDRDIHVAIHNLLEIINQYFDADRTYIFEIDYERNIIVNTHEYVKNGVSQQMDNLQEIPLDVIAVWMEKFRKYQVYYISSLEQEKGSPSYEILKEQDIERLLAVPLKNEGTIIGFLGVDNPAKHYNDATLLSSIQFFITNSLSTKKQQEQLQYLSYRDMLTRLYNRNRYIEDVERYMEQRLRNVGVAYLDLNGLKKINDEQGHEAGDAFIRSAAGAISSVFEDNCYRVGGDEFVILCCDIDRDTFYQKIEKLHEAVEQNKVSVSAGVLWKENVDDIESLLKEADRCMYIEKERYHRENGDYRR